MAKCRKRWIIVWLIGFVLPLVLIEGDEVARRYDIRIGFGYELILFVGLSLAVCTLAIAVSRHPPWLKALLVLGTVVGLLGELTAIGVVSLVLHGLSGTQ